LDNKKREKGRKEREKERKRGDEKRKRGEKGRKEVIKALKSAIYQVFKSLAGARIRTFPGSSGSTSLFLIL